MPNAPKSQRKEAVRKRRQRKAALLSKEIFGPQESGWKESPAQRENLAIMLSLSADDRMRSLARDALMPELKTVSFAHLALAKGITLNVLSEEIKSIRKSEGFIRASQHLPDLMEQTARDARSKWEECTACEGLGRVPDLAAWKIEQAQAKERGEDPRLVPCPEKRCSTCKGEGKVYVLGDATRLKMTFETFGLLGEGRGPLVALDLRKMDQPESLAALAGSVAGCLEGEVVESKEPKP